jgi:hypothetical protein
MLFLRQHTRPVFFKQEGQASTGISITKQNKVLLQTKVAGGAKELKKQKIVKRK